MPGRRPTQQEIEQRVALCRDLLLGHRPKGQIKAAMRQRFGPLHAETKAQTRIDKLMRLEGDNEAPELEQLLRPLPEPPANALRAAMAHHLSTGGSGSGCGGVTRQF